jgi:hypothetical protein
VYHVPLVDSCSNALWCLARFSDGSPGGAVSSKAGHGWAETEEETMAVISSTSRRRLGLLRSRIPKQRGEQSAADAGREG